VDVKDNKMLKFIHSFFQQANDGLKNGLSMDEIREKNIVIREAKINI